MNRSHSPLTGTTEELPELGLGHSCTAVLLLLLYC